MHGVTHITIIAQCSLITTVIILIVLLAVMTVGALALPSTDHLTVTLTIIKTALLIQVGCGLHIILHQIMSISTKISNIHSIIFYNDSFSLLTYHHTKFKHPTSS